MTRDYKDTVFLPKTPFSMKANLAVREKDFLAYWQKINIYKTLREQSKGRKKFILHWGPPYANGHLHCGHALSYILKDLVNKSYQMAGYDAPFIPGWDCHGLPIELKVEEQYKAKNQRKEDVDVLEYIESCRTYANKWIDIQSEEFQRFGIIANWKNPYVTMDFKSEAKIVAELGKFLMNGGLYRGLKPVMWSVVEKTALAEAEVEYHDHTSDAIFVAFPIVKPSVDTLKNAHAVIWTTTPWTLPGNRAIAYGHDHSYSVIEVLAGTDLVPNGMRLLVAKDLVTQVVTSLGIENYGIIGHVNGENLKGTICRHPWHGQGYDFDVPMLPGEHVTTEAGTGLVHTAPGHGIEDFAVGQEFGIEVPETVQGDGVYYAHVPLFAGKHIFKVGADVLAALKEVGALLHAVKLVHSYPHSWRSKAPLIYRATSQWFISMDTNGLRKKAMQEIDKVEWFPATGKNRISAMVTNRPDWCLSRQRTWGVPITVFVHKATGEALRDEAVHQRIVDAISKEGIAAWHKYDSAYFLGSDYSADDFEKATDILDVWFDSACTHVFTLEDNLDMNWPADMYFEGSDQHRGWFQTSLLQSCGTRGRAPFRQVVTHGFVLDEKGYKMSKSQGNGVEPSQVIESMGADMLRLWVASSDYTDDVRIGKEILKHHEDVYRRFRNTLRYLLGALAGYDPKNEIAYDKLPNLEQWVLHRLKDLEKSHQKLFKTYDFADFYSELHSFCAMDLSAFYFDIRKDTLYCDAPNGQQRLATLTVMHHVFMHLVHWLAPVVSFTAEEAWHAYQECDENETPSSIHTQHFPEAPRQWDNPSMAARWEDLRNIRRVLTGALELERAAKTIGSSLQASVVMYVSSEWSDRLNDIDWAELAIASQLVIVHAQMPANAFTLEDVRGIGVAVELAEGQKCGRCWKILPEVGSQREPDLCKRCDEVIHDHF
jgi:isoleucyl-tRNA synthetase